MSRVDFVGLARQPAGAGTKVTVMEYFPPVESSEPDPNRETLTIEETMGNRFPPGIDYGTRTFAVPMAGAPHMASIPRIVSGFLGQPDSAVVATHQQHTFDPAIAGKVPEWHSIFVVRNDPTPPIVDLFWDARGNELALDVAPNDFLKMNAGWIALDLDDAQAAPVPTTDATAKRKFSECQVYLSTDGGVTEDAIAVAAWGVTYTNQLDTDEAILGSRKLYALPYGNAGCEVRFSPREDMNAHYRRALANDPTQIRLRMEAVNVAASEKFEWLVYSCETVTAPAPASGASVLKMVEVTAQARLDPTTGKFVRCRVTNAVAAY